MVPKEYWSKQPVGLRWLFLIDVTAEAANRGYLDGFCEGIMSALYGGETDESQEEGKTQRLPKGAKVGIITFDKEIQFYNLSAGLDKAQMMVMPDIEEPFVPLSDGLFVDPEESKAVITSLLTQLPTMFAEVKNPEPALLPVLNSALAALTATGGKVVCSLSALPTWGPGRLFLRDDGNMHNTDAEKKLLTTEHPGYRKVAQKMVEGGIGIDFFLAAPSGGYLDIATIGELLRNVTTIGYALTLRRICFRSNWRRSLLLPNIPLPSRRSQTIQGNQTHSHARDRVSSSDEGQVLERPPSLCLPWQLLPSHLWRRPGVWSH
jgi:protein transport protein SEC24